MYLRNREELSVKNQDILTWASFSETRNCVSERRGYARPSRSGVLLLVVLSMLVLFMLIGTAFLMSSDQSRKTAKEMARKDRLGNNPTNELDRALLRLVRDTDNSNSPLRGHSLLRDLYGTDGFQGVIYSPRDADFNPSFPTTVSQATRFAAGTVDDPGTPVREELGPTLGQFVDIYVRSLGWDFSTNPPTSLDDLLTPLPNNESAGLTRLFQPDLRHMLKLDRNVLGQVEINTLPITKGYYNGCLMTITSGPAAGQSTRIVDYECVVDSSGLPYIDPSRPTSTPPVFTRIFRFRVMAFPRSDGQPLQINSSRAPEIGDLAGVTFVVNGRPFNGTGVGFNPFAAAGKPRLTALDVFPYAGDAIGAELALLPNAKYFNPETVAVGSPGVVNPFAVGIPVDEFSPLNDFEDRTFAYYTNFVGPGGADESYDAADFQNLFLALISVTPRARGRVVQSDGSTPPIPLMFEVDHTRVFDRGVFVNTDKFLRLDLEDVPMPSFHRPDLVNFWYHRLLMLISDGNPTDEHVHALFEPYEADGTPRTPLNAQQAALITAIKRRIMLRPIREDHPNFDGSNPNSVAPTQALANSNNLVRNGNIAIPYWEAIGPWDVDNDNDGVADSIWLDPGDPVQELEDGTRYKAIVSYLIIDLDSRLNVNAHGLADHINPANLALGKQDPNDPNSPIVPIPNLAGTNLNPGINTQFSSNLLAQGIGYGPAEISLRPLFPKPWMSFDPSTGAPTAFFEGNRKEDLNGNGVQQLPPADRPIDSLAALFAGRIKVDGDAVSGRYGFAPFTMPTGSLVAPGINYFYALATPPNSTPTGEQAVPDVSAQLKFFEHPWAITHLSAFGSSPDLFGRYALGIDYVGQPVVEVARDWNSMNAMLPRPLLTDSPYELDLSSPQRRDTWSASFSDSDSAFTASLNQSDDAAFATADLERILRAWDADSGTLPSRLWDVVDVFDPLKLMEFDPLRVTGTAITALGVTSPTDADRLATAQQMAAISRRVVTTDTSDLPVPGGNFLSRLIYGADGQPGRAGVNDDDPTNTAPAETDDPSEVGWLDSDDFSAVMNPANTVPIGLPGDAPADTMGDPMGQVVMPQNPTIVDLLKYRVQLERLRRRLLRYDENQLMLVVQQLLAPELIAGKRMDLNRPFGDGRDNAGDGIDNNGNGVVDEASEAGDPHVNGVVDDPLEAGDPFVDSNGSANGRYDPGETYYDMNGDGLYTPPLDRLWAGLTAEPIVFDYNHGSALLRDAVSGVTRLTDGRPHDGNADGRYDPNTPTDGRIRSNGVLQRQIFARHLYCLAMLLMDENYMASQNVTDNPEGNINSDFEFRDLWYAVAVEIAERNGRPGTPPKPDQADLDEAEPIAKALILRKLTARRIAQWAINTVDFRDPDAVMTPFEYDENPFDGWGVLDPNNNFISIDGDIASDENWGQPQRESDGSFYPRKFDWTKAVSATNPRDPNTENATRGVVWGVERPELLITETLALHDRRATDEEGQDSEGAPNASILNTSPTSTTPPDYDLDQEFKPRGSLFFELYNPWTKDGKQPGEFYDRTVVDASTNPDTLSDPGVMLNRLSSIPARWTHPVTNQTVVKRSPVWRVAVVRDPINGKLSSSIIDVSQLNSPTNDEDRKAYASQLLSTDVDGYGFNSDADAERLIYFTTGGDTNRADDNYLLDTGVPAPGGVSLKPEYAQDPVTREMIPAMDNLAVWVPPLPFRAEPSLSPPRVRWAQRYFIARQDRQPNPGNDRDMPIAPILPGRYAVVGSSGTQLIGMPGALPNPTPDGQMTQRFVTPISQLADTEVENPRQALFDLLKTRRVELWPSVDPREQQLLAGENGGQEFVNLNGTYVNVTDVNNDGTPNRRIETPNFVVEPSVAIPVEDMNVSEPVEGYPSIQYQKVYERVKGTQVSTRSATLDEQSGEYIYDAFYDRPLDMELELVRNGTTQNYKSLHLQRLADPSLPWNPPPLDRDGKPNPLHQVNFPVNPYRTIDSQSANLTAYNGASLYERTELMREPQEPGPTNPNPVTELGDLLQADFFAPLSATEVQQAPDHVIRGLIRVLREEGILTGAGIWMTPQEFREATQLQQWLDRLEADRRTRAGEPQSDDRGKLTTDTEIGEWRWHQLRRVLPDDRDVMAANPNYNEADFLQRLNLKSLERGGHHLQYYKFKDAAPPPPEGWWFDPRWEPRLLWKQERPDVMLILKGSAGSRSVKATDLKNVRSGRVLKGERVNSAAGEDYISQDEKKRSDYLRNNNLLKHQASGETRHIFDFVLEHTLGFVNEAYAPDLDRNGGTDQTAVMTTLRPGAPEVVTDPNRVDQPTDDVELNTWNTKPQQKMLLSRAQEEQRREKLMRSTYPWFAWNDRPFVSAQELTQVPASSSSLMLREYSVVNRQTPNPYDGNGLMDPLPDPTMSLPIAEANADRVARQYGVFGHLLNFTQSADKPAGTYATTTASPEPLSGAPNFYRVLEFVQVPSRYVGTDANLTAEIFNDVPATRSNPMGTEIIGVEIFDPSRPDLGFNDPRYNFQPPFNKVSRERDPGRVNLNTVTGRRIGGSWNGDYKTSTPARMWSEVFDGLMHRVQDGNNLPNQLGHLGPAWRDVVLSRRGYAQFNATPSIDPTTMMPVPIEKDLGISQDIYPDVFAHGLNPNFPSVFSNPFRAPDAGDLVPLAQMVQEGVDASLLRRHHFTPGPGTWGWPVDTTPPVFDGDDNFDGTVDDAREAGFGHDELVFDRTPTPNGTLGTLLRPTPPVFVPAGVTLPVSGIALFSETFSSQPMINPAKISGPFFDGPRNSAMYYQPMTRLANLVTNRSGVFAVWITVGYFEVEKAPNWNDPDPSIQARVRARFNNDEALYNRVYPDGYMLGKEVGSDTGDTKRHRGFYIVDRTEEVGFKPGEDLNVEKMIRLRRRIE